VVADLPQNTTTPQSAKPVASGVGGGGNAAQLGNQLTRIELVLEQEIGPLQDKVNKAINDASVPNSFWDSQLGKAFQLLKEVLKEAYEDLRSSLDKVKAEISQRDAAPEGLAAPDINVVVSATEGARSDSSTRGLTSTGGAVYTPEGAVTSTKKVTSTTSVQGGATSSQVFGS